MNINDIEAKLDKLIPNEVDILFSDGVKAICSRQAIVNLYRTEIEALMKECVPEEKEENVDGLIRRYDIGGKDKWGEEYAEKLNERVFAHNQCCQQFIQNCRERGINI